MSKMLQQYSVTGAPGNSLVRLNPGENVMPPLLKGLSWLPWNVMFYEGMSREHIYGTPAMRSMFDYHILSSSFLQSISTFLLLLRKIQLKIENIAQFQWSLIGTREKFLFTVFINRLLKGFKVLLFLSNPVLYFSILRLSLLSWRYLQWQSSDLWIKGKQMKGEKLWCKIIFVQQWNYFTGFCLINRSF